MPFAPPTRHCEPRPRAADLARTLTDDNYLPEQGHEGTSLVPSDTWVEPSRQGTGVEAKSTTRGDGASRYPALLPPQQLVYLRGAPGGQIGDACLVDVGRIPAIGRGAKPTVFQRPVGRRRNCWQRQSSCCRFCPALSGGRPHPQAFCCARIGVFVADRCGSGTQTDIRS